MKIGIVIFPGSNCDRDAFLAIDSFDSLTAEFLWHKQGSIPSDMRCIVLPGGFSYGDYLRSGAIARFSPIMREIVRFASRDGLVLGICNGFQILTEAGLLPGALLRNWHQRFLCHTVHVRVENTDTPFTNAYRAGEILRIPIAHGEGRFYADPELLIELEEHQQIIFRYANPDGVVSPESNPNGSLANIAGICNRKRNILGLMPHPERACEPILGSVDGRGIFESLLHYFEGVRV